MNHLRHGFTLLELLVVIAIMVILMTIAVASYGSIRRGAEIRGAVMTLRTTLMLARQDAVTKRKNVTVEFKKGASLTDPDTMNVLSCSVGRITTNSVVSLPRGIQYDDSADLTSIIFKPSGNAMGIGFQKIIVTEKPGAVVGTMRGSRTVTVWFLTGITKEGN